MQEAGGDASAPSRRTDEYPGDIQGDNAAYHAALPGKSMERKKEAGEDASAPRKRHVENVQCRIPCGASSMEKREI